MESDREKVDALADELVIKEDVGVEIEEAVDKSDEVGVDALVEE